MFPLKFSFPWKKRSSILGPITGRVDLPIKTLVPPLLFKVYPSSFVQNPGFTRSGVAPLLEHLLAANTTVVTIGYRLASANRPISAITSDVAAVIQVEEDTNFFFFLFFLLFFNKSFWITNNASTRNWEKNQTVFRNSSRSFLVQLALLLEATPPEPYLPTKVLDFPLIAISNWIRSLLSRRHHKNPSNIYVIALIHFTRLVRCCVRKRGDHH